MKRNQKVAIPEKRKIKAFLNVWSYQEITIRLLDNIRNERPIRCGKEKRKLWKYFVGRKDSFVRQNLHPGLLINNQ